ncbi:hypothetical protein [Oscillatoria salina]|uniref:hypothetical protein n=1 Tax=Oscillatoria salina TaxID=331517 RepID=UPI001CCB3F7F|nr:hypothetical protein [Oscillatoria salina]
MARQRLIIEMGVGVARHGQEAKKSSEKRDRSQRLTRSWESVVQVKQFPNSMTKMTI